MADAMSNPEKFAAPSMGGGGGGGGGNLNRRDKSTNNGTNNDNSNINNNNNNNNNNDGGNNKPNQRKRRQRRFRPKQNTVSPSDPSSVTSNNTPKPHKTGVANDNYDKNNNNKNKNKNSNNDSSGGPAISTNNNTGRNNNNNNTNKNNNNNNNNSNNINGNKRRNNRRRKQQGGKAGNDANPSQDNTTKGGATNTETNVAKVNDTNEKAVSSTLGNDQPKNKVGTTAPTGGGHQNPSSPEAKSIANSPKPNDNNDDNRNRGKNQQNRRKKGPAKASGGNFDKDDHQQQAQTNNQDTNNVNQGTNHMGSQDNEGISNNDSTDQSTPINNNSKGKGPRKGRNTARQKKVQANKENNGDIKQDTATPGDVSNDVPPTPSPAKSKRARNNNNLRNRKNQMNIANSPAKSEGDNISVTASVSSTNKRNNRNAERRKQRLGGKNRGRKAADRLLSLPKILQVDSCCVGFFHEISTSLVTYRQETLPEMHPEFGLVGLPTSVGKSTVADPALQQSNLQFLALAGQSETSQNVPQQLSLDTMEMHLISNYENNSVFASNNALVQANKVDNDIIIPPEEQKPNSNANNKDQKQKTQPDKQRNQKKAKGPAKPPQDAVKPAHSASQKSISSNKPTKAAKLQHQQQKEKSVVSRVFPHHLDMDPLVTALLSVTQMDVNILSHAQQPMVGSVVDMSVSEKNHNKKSAQPKVFISDIDNTSKGVSSQELASQITYDPISVSLAIMSANQPDKDIKPDNTTDTTPKNVSESKGKGKNKQQQKQKQTSSSSSSPLSPKSDNVTVQASKPQPKNNAKHQKQVKATNGTNPPQDTPDKKAKNSKSQNTTKSRQQASIPYHFTIDPMATALLATTKITDSMWENVQEPVTAANLKISVSENSKWQSMHEKIYAPEGSTNVEVPVDKLAVQMQFDPMSIALTMAGTTTTTAAAAGGGGISLQDEGTSNIPSKSPAATVVVKTRAVSEQSQLVEQNQQKSSKEVSNETPATVQEKINLSSDPSGTIQEIDNSTSVKEKAVSPPKSLHGQDPEPVIAANGFITKPHSSNRTIIAQEESTKPYSRSKEQSETMPVRTKEQAQEQTKVVQKTEPKKLDTTSSATTSSATPPAAVKSRQTSSPSQILNVTKNDNDNSKSEALVANGPIKTSNNTIQNDNTNQSTNPEIVKGPEAKEDDIPKPDQTSSEAPKALQGDAFMIQLLLGTDALNFFG